MASKPRLASGPPAATGRCSNAWGLGSPMRVFCPRAARTWAVARRPAEQCNCASLWQLFKACNDTAVLRNSLARGRAAQFFSLYRLAAAQAHSPTAVWQQLRHTTAPHGRFAIRSAVCPKPVLTAPRDHRRNGNKPTQSLRSTPQRRPQPLATTAHAGSTARPTKPPKLPPRPRRKVAPDPRVAIAAPTAGVQHS